MSNIPDITSLSDLLTTSPTQSLTEQRPTNTLQLGLATTKSLNDIIENHHEQDEKVEKELTVENEITDSEVKNKDIERTDSLEIQVKKGVIDNDDDDDDDNDENIHHEEEELTELLNLRSHKLQLSEERTKLLKKRSSLNLAIEDMKIKIAAYHNTKENESNKIRLQELLDNNTDEFIQNDTSNASKQESTLKKLNVLPSLDWELRLALVKKFLSSIEIDKVKTYNEFNENDELERKMEYTIISPLLFRILINLNIKASDDSMDKITIDNKSKFAISDISPSFYSVMKNNYIKGKKIDLIMYGLNSLSSLAYERVSVFHKLIRQFKEYVDKNRFQELIGPEELNNGIQLFALLKSVDRIELSVTSNDKVFKLCLIWELVLSQVSLGECDSNIKLQVYSDNSDFGDISALFLKLLNEGGVINALKVVLKKCFNIEVS